MLGCRHAVRITRMPEEPRKDPKPPALAFSVIPRAGTRRLDLLRKSGEHQLNGQEVFNVPWKQTAAGISA